MPAAAINLAVENVEEIVQVLAVLFAQDPAVVVQELVKGVAEIPVFLAAAVLVSEAVQVVLVNVLVVVLVIVLKFYHI